MSKYELMQQLYGRLQGSRGMCPLWLGAMLKAIEEAK